MKIAIPNEWLNEIQSGEGRKQGEFKCFFFYQNKRMEFKLGNVKMFYNIFMGEAFKKPNSNDMWLRHFKGLSEEEIWQNMRGVLISTELESLDYFIRHNVIYTEMRLCLMKKEQNALCKVCKQQDEGLLHLFLLCEKLRDFTKMLKNMMNELREKTEEEDWQRSLMLGMGEKCKNRGYESVSYACKKGYLEKKEYS